MEWGLERRRDGDGEGRTGHNGMKEKSRGREGRRQKRRGGNKKGIKWRRNREVVWAKGRIWKIGKEREERGMKTIYDIKTDT